MLNRMNARFGTTDRVPSGQISARAKSSPHREACRLQGRPQKQEPLQVCILPRATFIPGFVVKSAAFEDSSAYA